MCRKQCVRLLFCLGLMATWVQAATVVWVSDDKSGTQADQLWFELLEDGNYEMIEDFRARQGRGTLTADQIAVLEAADLIIVSRDTNSGNYNNDQWNQLTTPIIQLNAYLARSNRWGWLESTSAVKGLQPTMEIALGQEQHPVFRSLGFDEEHFRIDILIDVQSFLNVFEVGNGELLSYRADDTGWPWIVYWEANTEFYPGAGRTAAGPRMYFAGSADSEAQIGPPGAMNFTREGQIILLNAVDFMTGQNHPYPTLPMPVADAMVDTTTVELMWRAGISAKSHRVYLGTSAAEVEACAQSALLTTTEEFSATANSLSHGQTYYWRVVEVNESHPDSPWKGGVWNFQIRSLSAFAPQPLDTEPWVPVDANLAWDYGVGAVAHDLYLSTNQQEVIDRNPTAYQGRLTNINTNDPNTNYDPADFEPGQTYYWSVDEIMADGSNVTGPVWQFTSVATEVDSLEAQYFDNRAMIGNPLVTRSDDYVNFNAANDSWPPDPITVTAPFSARWAGEVQIPFTDTYLFIGTGYDGVRIHLDGELIVDYWQQHGADAISSASAPIDLSAGSSHSIVMEYFFDPASPGTNARAHLEYSSTQFTKRAIPRGAFSQPVKAYAPKPVQNAAQVDAHTTLAWGGTKDAVKYHVYLGTDREALTQATVDSATLYQGPQTETSITPAALDWNTTYFWRVDVEVADGAVSPGWVWSFTTANAVIVDDFEGYGNTDGSWVWETWADGYGGTTDLGGSQSGHLTGALVETTIVHGGFASFPMYYDNDGQFYDFEFNNSTPVYSEVRRDFEPAENWAEQDGKALATLSLWFRGRTDIDPNNTMAIFDPTVNNAAAALYLVVTDTTGTELALPHDLNPGAVNLTEWTQWSIALERMSSQGLDLTQVKSLGLRIGDKQATEPGGTGLLLIDDIRLHPATVE